MPINPVTTLPIFQGALSSGGLLGIGSGLLAAGLSEGLFQYLSSSVIVTSIDVGTIGAGNGIGFGLFIEPNSIISSLTPMLAGHGIFGKASAQTAISIASAISTSMAGAVIETFNPSVGIGTGKVQVIPTGNGGLTFSQALVAAGLKGMMGPAFGDAVGQSMDSVISSSIGAIVISGPTSVLPSSGSGVGKIL